MKIWKVKGDINWRECFDVEDFYNNKLNLYNFHDKDVVEDWPGLKVSFISHKKRIDACELKNITEFSFFSFLFVCDEYAKNIISQKYNCIQFLPVTPIEKEYAEKTNFYLPNVLNVVEVLDEEKSECRYLQDKYLVEVTNYYFKEEALKYPIFYLKVKDHVFLDLFVTDEFKKYTEEANISGFSFEEVFDFDKIERGN